MSGLPNTSAERVVIVGGAIMGSFTAWALRRAGHGGSITVVEKDPTYQCSSTALSAASIRTQFGTPTDIQVLGAEELRAGFPGIDFGGVAVGTFGRQHEGWFDTCGLLSLVRRAARQLGVDNVQAAIKAVETDDARVTGAVLPDGQRCASGHRHRCTKPLFTERSRT